MKPNLTFATFVVAATLSAPAQPTSRAAFEVATIRPSAGGPGGFVPGVHNGRFTTTICSLGSLIGFAFSIPEVQIHGPAWLSQTFDVTATLPAGAAPDQAPGMLRSLLEERFHLRVHRESTEMSYYALEIVKGGFKLRPRQPDDPIPSMYGPGTVGTATLMTNAGVAEFAQSLARVVGRPVLDKTELAGRYFLWIRYSGPNAKDSGPDVFTALQEQLGLRLASRRGPVSILVVDSVDRTPTDN